MTKTAINPKELQLVNKQLGEQLERYKELYNNLMSTSVSIWEVNNAWGRHADRKGAPDTKRVILQYEVFKK